MNSGLKTKSNNQPRSDAIAGSYLTFRSGNTNFALDVRKVVYITAMDAITSRSVPDPDSHNHRVFPFQDQQVPLFSLCELMGTRSQSDQSLELADMLKQRRQDHIDWMDALEQSIQTGAAFTKATDPHQCAFGLWYDQYKAEDEQLQDIMKKFDAPHKRIHALAQQLLSLAKTQPEDALSILKNEKSSTLKLLLDLFSQADMRLQDMLRPVVVILQGSTQQFAIELDGIDGIKDFSDKDWLPDTGTNDDLPCYDGYFQLAEGPLFVKLDTEYLLV